MAFEGQKYWTSMKANEMAVPREQLPGELWLDSLLGVSVLLCLVLLQPVKIKPRLTGVQAVM